MIITVEAKIGKDENNTFEEMAARVYEVVMRLGREMVSQALEARDEELMKSRDKKRYRCKGKQKTSIKTKLGVIEFRRNVYVDNSVAEGKRCVHLLDEDLRIERIGQISKEVCQAAGELVCESSYRAAAKAITENSGLSISPQGVWNERGTKAGRHAEGAGGAAHGTCAEKAGRGLYTEQDSL